MYKRQAYEGVNDNPYVGFVFTDIDRNLMAYFQASDIGADIGL